MSDFTSPTECKAYAALTPSAKFEPFSVTRRACGPKDVVIEIKFAGICHSDIHQVREEWGKAIFPMVPGHEIGGVVVAVGPEVRGIRVGEHAGIGCLVDSCRDCKKCKLGDEQYCLEGGVFTYNSKFKYPHCLEYNNDGGNNTYGGYSKHIVVDEAYVLKVPKNLDLAGATPLMCAGITVYSPMKRVGLRPAMKLGVGGLGGVGHKAAQFCVFNPRCWGWGARGLLLWVGGGGGGLVHWADFFGVAFECHTTVISRGTAKKESSLNDLKVHAYLDSKNEEEMKVLPRSHRC
jgi:uncharacterized zinc-type alcohol dehydrogenase-like protein